MDCPECGNRLGEQTSCRCGWRRVDLRRPQDPMVGRCAWETLSRRCLQRGVYSPSVVGGTQVYCSWHAECLKNSKTTRDRERFDQFLDFLRKGLYCTVWTHFDPEVLWNMVHGELTSAKPEPCRNPSCSIRLDMERELGNVLPDPLPIPHEPLTQLLGRRLSVSLPTGDRTAEDKARLEVERLRQLEVLNRMVGGHG